jgi:YVTN family beta-propeller protein
VNAHTDTVTKTFALTDQPLAASADPGRHRVSFTAGDTVVVVDSRTAAVLRTIDIGRTAGDIAVDTSTGLAYVTSTDDNTVTTVSTVTGAVVRRTNVGPATGNSLLSVAVDPRTHQVFVASYDAHQVVVVDGGTGHVTARVGVGGAPVDIAVDAPTGKAYVADGSATIRVITP